MSDTAGVADAAVNGALIATMANQPGRGEMADNAEKMRAKSIEDNLGVQPQSLEEYREEHGGRGWLKAAAFVAGGLLLGAAAIAVFHVVALPLLIGGLAGAIGGSLSMGHQANKVREGYDSYLDDAAREGRALRSQEQTPQQAQEYDNGAGRTTTHLEHLKAREQQQAQGKGLS